MQDSPRGYLPDLTNSILVISDPNIAQLECLLWGEVLIIIKGSLYLGGYIGYTGTQAQYLGEKVQDWEV